MITRTKHWAVGQERWLLAVWSWNGSLHPSVLSCADLVWKKEMDWEQWFSKTLHQGLCVFTRFPSDSNIHQSLRITDLETGLIDSKGAIQTYFKSSTWATRSKHCLIWADSAKLTPGRSVFFNQSAIVPAVDLIRGKLLLSHVAFCWSIVSYGNKSTASIPFWKLISINYK